MSGQDPNNEIEELRETLRRHEIKIQELEQQKEEDREEKKRLENEVRELKKRIQWLEDEVRYFSTKPVITDLKSQLKEKDGEINQMKKFCEEIETRLMNAMSKVKSELKNEIQYFKEGRDNAKAQLGNMKAQLGESTDSIKECKESRNMLFIGQLCAKSMEAVYRQVLPVYFERGDDYKQPHLRAIDAKIRELCQTEKDEEEAREKWRKLKAEIGEDLVEFMEKKLDQRHTEAHPPLNENELKEIAKELPGQEQRHLEKVIRLWLTGFRFQVLV